MSLLAKNNSGGYSWAECAINTQATSTTTGVTVNALCFIISTFAQTLAAGASVTFTVSNNLIPPGNLNIQATIVNYGGAFSTNGIPVVNIDNVVSGVSFDVVISNVHSANALSGAIMIAFLAAGSNNT